jgi:hypothetical protein
LGITLLEAKSPDQKRELATVILSIATPAEPLLTRISLLLKRPSASFPLHYEDNFSIPMPHVSEFLWLGQLLVAKSLAELELGDAHQAKLDVLMILALSKTLQDEPLTIPLLVRESMIAIAVMKHRPRDRASPMD